MSIKKERRTFSEEFKNQIVQLFNAGKTKSDIFREYELSPTVIDRWIKTDQCHRFCKRVR